MPATGGGLHCIHTRNIVHRGSHIFKSVRVIFWFPGGVIPVTLALVSFWLYDFCFWLVLMGPFIYLLISWSSWPYTSFMIFAVPFCLSLSLFSFCHMTFHSVGSSPTWSFHNDEVLRNLFRGADHNIYIFLPRRARLYLTLLMLHLIEISPCSKVSTDIHLKLFPISLFTASSPP